MSTIAGQKYISAPKGDPTFERSKVFPTIAWPKVYSLFLMVWMLLQPSKGGSAPLCATIVLAFESKRNLKYLRKVNFLQESVMNEAAYALQT